MIELKKQAQQLLVDKGYNLGTSGPAHNGVDGADGMLTWQAIVAALSGAAPVARPAPPSSPAVEPGTITLRTALELVGHEAIVQEAYRDSEGIWTWGVGVTDSSGHSVMRYKDNPQPIAHVLAVYVWLLRQSYLPDVLKAFAGHALTEAELAAALSFHYNTGAIRKSEWVSDVLAGKPQAARAFLENHYLNGGDLQQRRNKEAALFFDGKWSNDGTALVIPVRKPSYQPDFRHAQRLDITADMTAALAGAAGA